MSVPLFAGPHAHRAFVVGRADTFTAQEMAATHRLQRLLGGLDRQITAFSRWSQRNGTTGAEAADGVCLTPRELAVLELLASSLTATAIGRRLGIAERTVQKHLQRGYAKLGVADRLAAVQRAQAIGVLRAP
jgi:ATP/maltotriose-dependent transcriptional regulator MalT